MGKAAADERAEATKHRQGMMQQLGRGAVTENPRTNDMCGECGEGATLQCDGCNGLLFCRECWKDCHKKPMKAKHLTTALSTNVPTETAFGSEVKDSLLGAMMAAGIVTGPDDANWLGMSAEEAAKLLGESDIDPSTVSDPEVQQALLLAKQLAAGDASAAHELVARHQVCFMHAHNTHTQAGSCTCTQAGSCTRTQKGTHTNTHVDTHARTHACITTHAPMHARTHAHTPGH